MAAPRYANTRTVYDATTGEAVTLHAVDARERLACGLATEFPKTEDEDKSQNGGSSGEKKKPGRKPKGE